MGNYWSGGYLTVSRLLILVNSGGGFLSSGWIIICVNDCLVWLSVVRLVVRHILRELWIVTLRTLGI